MPGALQTMASRNVGTSPERDGDTGEECRNKYSIRHADKSIKGQTKTPKKAFRDPHPKL